ncbi:MAG: formate dehydrogenase [Burkholderiaceae bacterium]
MSQLNSQPTPALSRRRLFAGASTLGAIAAVVTVVPALRQTESAPSADIKAPAKGGGYSVTEHVKQYYKTTLV